MLWSMISPSTDVAGAGSAIIVCALEFERRALRRAGLGSRHRLHCCGPGADAITAWARRADPPRGPVLLAGLAGALVPGAPWRTGAAFVATAVRAESGALLRPSLLDLRPLPAEASSCLITSTDEVIGDPPARRALATATGAALVDLESVAFARTASDLGWTWGVVRGISDDAEARLPAGIASWVDSRGRSRPLRVLADLLRRPQILPELRRLRRDGEAALAAVATVTASWLGPP
jgi:hypothetical protein